MNAKPDFLYIGAPRTGSTWLFRNLQAHPGVWVPPCKNILYFHPRFQIYRLKFLKYFGGDMFKNPDPQIRAWYRHFFTRPVVNDTWYQSLFPQNNIIKGEIAEAYCSLPEEHITQIRKMTPDVKIIFTMRNPVERAISHAKLGVVKRKKRKLEEVSINDFISHIDHPDSEARSFYSKTLDLWMKHFPEEQFLIRFYEDLLDMPEKYLEDICNFIGIQYKKSYFNNNMEEIINSSFQDDIPHEILLYTAEKYKKELQILSKRYGGAAHNWLSKTNQLLEREAPRKRE